VIVPLELAPPATEDGDMVREVTISGSTSRLLDWLELPAVAVTVIF